MTIYHHVRICLPIVTMLLCVTSFGQPRRAMCDEAVHEKAGGRIGYTQHIRPIFVSRCLRCHGSENQEADLRLDIRVPHRAVVPGDADQSELIRRVISTDAEERMPPEGRPLSDEEVALLRRWIDEGAAGQPERAPVASDHWAFQPIDQPAIPAVKNTAWPQNSIDHFVLARLEHDGITPSPEAAPETLIRRLSLDLLGLPPAWTDVASFVADDDPNVYKHLVDQLLVSPHYGERWARHWLDLARYADSSGYEMDRPREIWRYRDWVIDALNRDMPFDKFVVEQLAGDLIPNASVEQQIATGFHCNAMLDPGVRWESVIDRVNTTGSVLLGLTLECGQCHDHKTDPLTQREYYELYAFFNEAAIHPLDLGSPDQIARRDSIQAEIDQLEEQLGKNTSSDEAAERSDLEAAITKLKEQLPKIPTSLVMKTAPQPTHIFVRGDHAQPGEQVTPAVPAFLHSLPESESYDRMDLADWIVNEQNPLTARVTVNRVWQRYFGRGLVDTVTDFGMQTPPPTHPELLDWLASEFISNGWSLKHLHRLIVTSATYRQSSASRPDLALVDPRNLRLARQRRLRLEAEIIRDVSLSVSGLQKHRIGGPSVFPYQPDGILNNRATPATWTISAGEDRYRRGLYTWVWRLTPHPMLPLFDAPDLVTACARRDRSNVPVQALTLLNDPAFVECARALATRILKEDAPSDDQRLVSLFRHCLSRNPQTDELDIARKSLAEQVAAFENRPEDVAQVVGSAALPSVLPHRQAAWIAVCRVILNLDETITRQ